jgi:hypothetical protein
LDSTFKVIIEIKYQWQMQYDDLKHQTPIKVSPFPPKEYGNGCILKHKAHTPQRKK